MKRATMMLLGLFFTAQFLWSQNSTLPTIALEVFATGFDNPVGIEHAGDDRLFVLEQTTGKVRIVYPDGTWSGHFLNLKSKIHAGGFEQGLLGIAFDPDYEENGNFYVHYTNKDENNQFSQFSVHPNNPDKAIPNSEIEFLEDDDPFANHNSGQMKFGPDGYLYIALGDGGSAGDPFNNAQNIGVLHGKLMRIDMNDDGTYNIPADNPYVGVEGALEEIWATGLRNPWRFTFDKDRGDLWIADVGQNSWEEINFQSAESNGGENYGWSCREGLHFFKADCDANTTPFTDPIAEYAHNNDPQYFCSGSVTGGYVYRGSLFPNMFGKYFYVDFCTGVMYTTYWDGVTWVSDSIAHLTPFAFSTFGEDINGELYLADKTNGIIYHIVDESEMLALPDTDENDVEAGPVYTNAYMLAPNPNDGDFKVRFESDREDVSVASVTDLMGRQVWTGTKDVRVGRNEWHINETDLHAGAYILQIQTSHGLNTIHFVVE